MTVNPNLPCDDEDIVADGTAENVALLTPPAADDAADIEGIASQAAAVSLPEAAEHVGPRCEHCEAPMATGQTFCKRCGFYPTLKTFVEVDAEAVDETGVVQERPKSHWEIWKSLIPAWGWGLIAGVVVILGMSIAARLMVAEGRSRALWTYAQYGIGMAAFVYAHIACYMYAIMLDSSLSFLDIILKPFAIWMVTLRDLPKTFKRVALGSWGQTAMLCAAFVVAGVRYDEIIDWGKVPPKKKPKPNVSAPIEAPSEDMTMEEAMDELAKNAGATPGDGKIKEQDKGDRQKMSKCLIVGFTPNRENDFASLILAVDEGGGRWRVAGALSEGITIEARSLLNRRMRQIMRSSPVLPSDYKAFWIEPKLMCTVWYEDWTEAGRFKRPFFDKLQPDYEPVRKTTP